MRMVWGCQSCQSNLLTLSYLLPSENDRSLFHSRLFRHIHKFSYSYHTLKKTLIMFDSIVFVKYPIREFCTPILYIICNTYLLMGIFFSWLDGPSLFGNKNVILDEMFQQNASKFVLFWNFKIQLFFHFVFQNDCKFWSFLLEHFTKHQLPISEECAPYGLLAQDIR